MTLVASRAATTEAKDIEALHNIKAAQKLLGHTTEKMTADYIRARRGDVVKPMSKKVKGG